MGKPIKIDPGEFRPTAKAAEKVDPSEFTPDQPAKRGGTFSEAVVRGVAAFPMRALTSGQGFTLGSLGTSIWDQLDEKQKRRATLGASQEATLGLSDESQVLPYLTQGAANVLGTEMFGVPPGESASDAARGARDAERQENRQAAAESTGEYGAGQLVGTALSLGIPGARGFGGQTARGAVYGTGKSEAESLSGVAKDASISALISGGASALVGGAGRLANKLFADRGSRMASAAEQKIGEVASREATAANTASATKYDKDVQALLKWAKDQAAKPQKGYAVNVPQGKAAGSQFADMAPAAREPLTDLAEIAKRSGKELPVRTADVIPNTRPALEAAAKSGKDKLAGAVGSGATRAALVSSAFGGVSGKLAAGNAFRRVEALAARDPEVALVYGRTLEKLRTNPRLMETMSGYLARASTPDEFYALAEKIEPIADKLAAQGAPATQQIKTRQPTKASVPKLDVEFNKVLENLKALPSRDFVQGEIREKAPIEVEQGEIRETKPLPKVQKAVDFLKQIGIDTSGLQGEWKDKLPNIAFRMRKDMSVQDLVNPDKAEKRSKYFEKLLLESRGSRKVK